MPKREDLARLNATAARRFRPRLTTWIVGGSVATLLLVSGGVAGALSLASTPAPASAEVALTVPSASPKPKPKPTPSPTPSPASLFTDEAPADPSTVSAPASDASVVAPDTTTTDTTALALLATITIKGKSPKTGYQRTGQFGSAWLDVDRNGCDTRNDILARDLTAIAKSGSCKVMTGTLVSPFTAATIAFVRGQDTSSLVQIDHVIALSNAWQTGAAQLTQAQRITFANDPMNLLAVDGRSNAQKGDGDTATWLPANKAFRCSYVARQVSVKATYGLWVTQAERDAMARVLGSCTAEPAVTSGFTPVPVVVVAPAPAPSGCDPNYGGGCVPIASDVDCAGGSGNGPEYVQGPVTVIGTDIYDLHRDGDGIAC